MGQVSLARHTKCMLMIATETFSLCSLLKKRVVCPPPHVDNLFRKKFTNIMKYELYITDERASKIKYLIIVNILSLVLIEILWINKINSRTKKTFLKYLMNL